MGQVYNITNYISFQELNTSNFYFTPFAIFLKQEPGRSALSTMKLSLPVNGLSKWKYESWTIGIKFRKTTMESNKLTTLREDSKTLFNRCQESKDLRNNWQVG